MTDWIYSNTKDNGARFLLGKRENPLCEKEGGRLLVTVGINPSTAEPGKLDNTVITVRNRALALGYDLWVTINIYPQRATDPNHMDRELNRALHKRNLEEIGQFISRNSKVSSVDIWAAWGALIGKRDYLGCCMKDIVHEIARYEPNWYTIGQRTKEGHPHHPLYLKKGLPMESFDINQYLEKTIGK